MENRITPYLRAPERPREAIRYVAYRDGRGRWWVQDAVTLLAVACRDGREARAVAADGNAWWARERRRGG